MKVWEKLGKGGERGEPLGLRVELRVDASGGGGWDKTGDEWVVISRWLSPSEQVV